jgi:hypothetical protein
MAAALYLSIAFHIRIHQLASPAEIDTVTYNMVRVILAVTITHLVFRYTVFPTFATHLLILS